MSISESHRRARIGWLIMCHWRNKRDDLQDQLKHAIPFTKKRKQLSAEYKYADKMWSELFTYPDVRDADVCLPALEDSEIDYYWTDGGRRAFEFLTNPFKPTLTTLEHEQFMKGYFSISILAGHYLDEYVLSEWDIEKKYCVTIAHSAVEERKFCIIGVETEQVVDVGLFRDYFRNAHFAWNEEKRRAKLGENAIYKRFDGTNSYWRYEDIREDVASSTMDNCKLVLFSRLGFNTEAIEKAVKHGVTTINLDEFTQIAENLEHYYLTHQHVGSIWKNVSDKDLAYFHSEN